jgi:HPt (histidine-containing phosphotransfer) domain-containing protein
MNQSTYSDDARSLLVKAVELAGGDRIVARHLLEMIVDTNQSTLAWLQQSIDAASWESVASAAHRIVGSARLLGDTELIALFTRLEEVARKRERVAVDALLPLVIGAVAKLDEWIKAAVSVAHQS